MNKGLTEVLVKRTYKDQIWFEIILIENDYEEADIIRRSDRRDLRGITLRRKTS